MRGYQLLSAFLIALNLAILPAAGDDAQTEEAKYQASIEAAAESYNASVRRAFEKHLRKLIAIKKAQRMKGDLVSAERLGQKIQASKEKGPPLILETRSRPLRALMQRLKGNWLVTYTNRTQHSREIHENQLVNDSEELVQKNGDLLIVFPKVIERITLVEGKLFVEHFNPRSSYPDGIPAVMGVGKRVHKK